MVGDGDGVAVNYDSLRFIELCGDGSKLPARKWGGYSQDFDDAKHVHTHEEIVDHSNEEWGIVDCEDPAHSSLSLLIFDIDSHKASEEFDPSRLTIPGETLVTRSQNGGFHVYFAVHDTVRGELNEGDFHVTNDLPFDIDIRGSAVSHHVVAPKDIPGCGGLYEIANNEPIQAVLRPTEACELVKLDGEPAIEYSQRKMVGDIDFDRPEEPPEDMPACYHAGLSLRKAAPNDPDLNTHKVNVLTALCGLAAGFDVGDVAEHMCGEYAPHDGDTDVSDEQETVYQVKHIGGMLESGQYSPPALSTLQDYGILDKGEVCGSNCPIDMHDHRSPAERNALDTVQSFIIGYDPIDERLEIPDPEDNSVSQSEYAAAKAQWPDESELDDVADAVATLTGEDYDALTEALEARVTQSLYGLDRHRTLSQETRETGSPVVNHDGELVLVDPDARWAVGETLSNFEFDVLSLLSIEGEGRMATVEVRPSEPTESEFDMQIEPRVFNDSRRFKDEVLSKRFSTTIETSMHESDVMDLLRKYISRQSVPDLNGQKQMGLSRAGDEFVTPNGTIDASGWTDEPETIYVERNIGAERKFAADPGVRAEIDEEDVARMIELFSRTRDPERFVPVLGWMYAAPFRPPIVERTGSFNLLFVTGESGVGKTGTLGVGSRMFGMSSEPFSCTDTTFAQITSLASSRGVPIWLDEYKASEMPDWQTKKLHELLRKAATGGVEQRGRADQTTEEYYLRAPVAVSGETAIRGSAEQRRAIDVAFTNQPTQSGTPEFQRFKDLAGDATTDEDGNVTFPEANYSLEEHAVAYYSHVAGMTVEEFESKWFGAREYVSRRLAEWDVELDELEVQGLQTVTFGFRMMRDFAENVEADLSLLPSESDLNDALRYVADVEGPGRETHTDQFIGLVQRATVARYVEQGTHYTVVREGRDNEEIRVNVTRAFDAVSKYVRDHDLSEDLLGSARDYKDRYEEAEERDESYVACTSQPSPPVGRAVGIRTERAEDKLETFDRSVFVNDESEDGDGDAVSDGDDGDSDDSTPIAELDPSAGTGYATVTAQVSNWQVGPEYSGIAEMGTVKDVTGPIRVIDFFGCPTEAGPLEEGDYIRIRDAKVDEYDGVTQLIIEKGTTDIETIQQGVGHTDPADIVDGQSRIGPSEQTSVEAVTDSGDTGSEAKEIDRAILAEAGDEEVSRGSLGGSVSVQISGATVDQINHRIDKLAQRGDIRVSDASDACNNEYSASKVDVEDWTDETTEEAIKEVVAFVHDGAVSREDLIEEVEQQLPPTEDEIGAAIESLADQGELIVEDGEVSRA
ncbi:bifunctional DNA primase/polymerase [Natrialbaceae archaeon A-CW1-1]